MSKRLISFLICGLLVFSSFSAFATIYRDDIYEPRTSIVMPATVAWEADEYAYDIFAADVRPASMIVYVDESLAVADQDDNLIWDHLDSLFEAATNVIPILYLNSEETAEAVLDYALAKEVGDFFVAAPFEKAHLVGIVAFPLPHVFGIIDASDLKADDEAGFVAELVARANSNGAPVVILSSEGASLEAVKHIQGLAITVWEKVSSDMVDILSALTKGVNGVLAESYEAAYDAMTLFDAEYPVILRRSGIAGHRGMPSLYIENTLNSALGALEAGADVIENDIYLNQEGEIFIIHDDNLDRLFNLSKDIHVEDMTLEELQAAKFEIEGLNGVLLRNNQPLTTTAYGHFEIDGSERIPTLREYFETFKDEDIIHFVEIKSFNPDIVPAVKALAEEIGVSDQMIVITFNVPILKAMYENWPEMTVGCLGMDGAQALYESWGMAFDLDLALPFESHAQIAEDQSVAAALKALYEVIGPYNGRYNPYHVGISMDMVKAGRHRGLTVWPWTYNDPKDFADAFLNTIYGITTNFTLWGTDMLMSVNAYDAKVTPETIVEKTKFAVELLNLKDEKLTIGGVEVIPIEPGDVLELQDNGSWRAKAEGEITVLLRAKGTIAIDGENYGNYYMYSPPVKLVVSK